MPTYYGGWNGHLRFILVIDWDPSNTGSSIDGKFTLKLESDGYAFGDGQSFSSSIGSDSFTNNLNGNSMTLVSKTLTKSTSYSGSEGSFSASLSGAFNGAKPTLSVSYSIPKRAPNVPDRPTNARYGSVTSSSFNLAADKGDSNGATITTMQFQISRSSSFDDTDTNNSSGSSTSYSGKGRSTRYYYRVRAINSVGASAWTPTESLVTADTAPDQPPKPEIYSVYATTIHVTGTNPDYTGGTLTDRQVQLDSNSSFSSPVTDSEPNYIFTDLTRGTLYYIRQRVRNDVGWSSWSPTLTQRTAYTVPSPVRDLKQTAVGITTATITWQAPSDNGGQSLGPYLIRRYKGTTSSTPVEYGSPATLFAATGLEAGTTYIFRVYAQNDEGYSTAASVTVKTNPANAQQPTQTGQTPSSINIEWLATAGAASYDWRLMSAPEGGTVVSSGSGTGRTATASGLAGSTYYWAQTRVATPVLGDWTGLTQVRTSDPVRVWSGTGWVWAEQVFIWNGEDWAESTGIQAWNGSALVPAANT